MPMLLVLRGVLNENDYEPPSMISILTQICLTELSFFFVAAKPLKIKCREDLLTAFPHKTRQKTVLTMGAYWVS